MSTFWPTRAEACSAWLEVIRLLRLSIWVERLLIPWDVDIEVIWESIWALSTGFSGSWFCICVTRSLRKRSALPASSPVP